MYVRYGGADDGGDDDHVHDGHDHQPPQQQPFSRIYNTLRAS